MPVSRFFCDCLRVKDLQFGFSRGFSPLAVSILKALAFAGAALMVVGWYFDSLPLIQHYGHFAELRLDTALCLLLITAANVLPQRWRVLPLVLIGVVGFVAVQTLLGYTLRFAQPIDQVIEGLGLVSASRTANLHMPFPTCVAMLMICLSMIISRYHRESALESAFGFALALVAGMVMLQDLISNNIFYPEPDYAGTHDVSLQSSILIVLISAELALRAWCKLRVVGYRRLDHYFAWSTVFLAAVTLTAWEYQERSDWDQRAFETQVALNHVGGEISKHIEFLATLQHRLASRWEMYGPPPQDIWERDAESVLQDSPGVFAIAYLDRDRTVRWRVSREGNASDFIGVRVDTDPIRHRAFDMVDVTSAMQMTPTLRMDNGDLVRLFLSPLRHDGKPDGYLLAALRLRDLPILVPADVADDFQVELRDYSTNAKGVLVAATEAGARLSQSTHIASFGQYWTVIVWPRPEYIQAHRSRLLQPTLVFGGLITFLVAAALAQTRRSQINIRRAAEATERLASTMDHISDGFITFDRTWRIVYANQQAAAIMGHPKEALLGHLAHGLSSPTQGASDNAALAFAMQGKGTGRYVGQYEPTGRWLDVTAYPTEDGIAVFFRDITRERARDEHLRLLETAVSRQNDVLVIAESDLKAGDKDLPRIVYVNEAFTRLTGWAADEVIGHSPRRLQGPKTSRATLDAIRQALEQRRPIQAELINYTKDGREYWIEMDITPIFDAEGRCTHFGAVERDITQRKRIEAQVIYNQERFQHIVDATNDIIWDADLETRNVTYNENLKKILGHDSSVTQFTTLDWENWVHPDDRARVTGVIADAVTTPAPPVEMEYRLRKADGAYALITDRAKVIRDTEGKPTRIVGTMSDVTERRAMSDRLRQAQQLEAVGQLTGGVAHDFNNLLTVILGNSEVLADRLEDQPKLRKLAEMTVTMALRGAELTSRLLAFARRQPLEPKVIAVNGLITSMEDWMRRTLPATIGIQISGAENLWPIEVDSNQLENALLNLAVNARDAMPQGGLLAISTANCVADEGLLRKVPDAKPGEYVRISVCDNGTGMDAETAARAFEPFFTTKAMGKGSGLGLSMVYGFVRQSSGFVLIDTVMGKGTTVHLYFPRAMVSGAAQKAPAVSGRPVGGSEHILAVEDEESVLENVVSQLSALGYQVSSAAAGSVALEMIRNDPSITLLFTDVVMPGDLSGPELVRMALPLRPDLKVLYTSGYSDDHISHDGKLEPGVNLLTKPYRLGDLAEKLRGVLDA